MEITFIVISILVVLLSIAIHEWAHAKFADMAGDPTPRMMGRVTLNPLAHLDPMGTIMIVVTSLTGYGIGWGKPVMVNPSKMRNPRWDHFTSVAAGPASNLIQAVVYAMILRLVLPGAATLSLKPEILSIPVMVCVIGVMVNIGLCLFNLIPLGPLDGHWLVGAFMPEPARMRWYQFNRGPGSIIFLALVLGPQILNIKGPLETILWPYADRIFVFLIGG